MEAIKRLLSDEYVFTQDYDSNNNTYTETFSLFFINIKSVSKIYLENLVLTPNFYKFFNVHENNILLSIVTGNLEQIDKYRNTNLLIDNRQGTYSIFNNQILLEKQSNIDKPIRFAYENENINNYNLYSALNILKDFNKIISFNATKSNIYNIDYVINNNDDYLFILLHCAGVQFTSIALNGYFNLGLYYIYD